MPSLPFASLCLVVLVGLLASTTGGCDRLRTGEATSAHARYGLSLGTGGQAWRAAADSALARSDSLGAPEPLRVRLDTASAAAGVQAWRLAVARGRVLVLAASADSSVFVDLYRADGAARPVWLGGLATATDGDGADTLRADTLRAEAVRADTFVVRVHARRGHATNVALGLRTAPALGFPVAGQDARVLGSAFGVDRDGGARSHEGVDLFAPRGTPVVAAADGFASPGTNRLGGNVVWLRDGERGLTHYYAHLDTVLVATGQRVRRGDTLGTVGNTGNARTTPPHLHFGLYDDGALDPAPFLRP